MIPRFERSAQRDHALVFDRMIPRFERSAQRDHALARPQQEDRRSCGDQPGQAQAVGMVGASFGDGEDMAAEPERPS
jgi:hypothetical protein